MSYLISPDLKRLIQSDNLTQIIGGDTSILTAAQLTAQEEAITYLIQKYNTAGEFTDTNIYDPTVIYKAASRVYLDATAYDGTATYAIGKLVLQSGKIYSCSITISVAEATFIPGHWALLGNQYDIFYASYPAPLFNLNSVYAKGVIVFWNDKKYTASIPTPLMGHETVLQYDTTDQIPYPNYFPGDVNNPQQWGNGVAYSVPAGTLPTNITYFTKGDNRSQAMVMYITDIALYHLHSRIAPRGIPDLRIKRYDDAINHLKGYSKGTTTANLTKIQPPSGKRIRYGSSIKQSNSY